MRQKITLIDIRKIVPYANQVRKKFNNIGELASSIVKEGLLDPLKVIKIRKNYYMLIDGERRYMSCKMLSERDGCFDKKIPCIVIPKPDNPKITQLITDIHKEKLTPIEEANAFKELIQKKKYTINDIKIRIGKQRNYVTKRLKLLAFEPYYQKKIEEGKIKLSVAESLSLKTIRKNSYVILRRIEEEKADVKRAKEIIYEENYKYESRIKAFMNRLNNFLADIKLFEDAIKNINIEVEGLTIKQALQDLEKLELNLGKVKIIEEKIITLKEKLNNLYKKFANNKIVSKEMLYNM